MKDKEKLSEIKKVVEEIENFYPLSVIHNPEGLSEKELLKKITDEIRELLGEKKYLLERFAWVWGNCVFKLTKKEILKTIEETIEELNEK